MCINYAFASELIENLEESYFTGVNEQLQLTWRIRNVNLLISSFDPYHSVV